jgi:glycosyltransferase involved in cell wall biosynthesis
MHGKDPFFLSADALQRARALLEKAIVAADYFVVVGTPLQDYAVALGVPGSEIKVVPNGTDIPSSQCNYSEQRKVGERRRIVSVSNLVALKGIQDNLQALSEISSRRPDLSWEYRIVGDGVARRELESLTDKLGLAEKVFFVGRLSYGETMREIEGSDIFSLPSWGEAFGIVYLEAMARMRPVIGCFENGAADIVTSGVDGLLVKPRSIPDLADALQKLLENPEYCRELGEQAYETAKRFTWDANVDRMLALLGLKAGAGPRF